MSLCDCSDSIINTIAPIEFINSLIKFRFIDIDVNVTINLESGDFLFIPGFKNTDSYAHINMPRELLNNLFLFNITQYDLSNSIWSNMKYAMNKTNWPDVSFCNALVSKDKAINPNARYQQLQLDFTRYIISTITGSIYYNGIFRNKDVFIQKIVSADASFNSNIKDIIDLCGTTALPMNNDSYYNNPCRVLLESILAQDNVLETDNVERKEKLITYMKNTVNVDFSNNATTPFYAIGRLVVNGPLKLIYTITISQCVINGTNYNTPLTLYSLKDIVNNKERINITQPLYTSSNPNMYDYTNNISIPTNHTNLSNYYNTFYPFHFIYGDSLSVRITYKPYNNTFLGKEIKDRSYEIFLNVGLETETNIPYKASGDEDSPAIVVSGNPKMYKANGINTAFQYIFFDTSLNEPYISPFNFYPTLFDISNISFSTRVDKRYPISSNVFNQNPGNDDLIIINNEVFDFSDWKDLMEPNINIGYMYTNTDYNVITTDAQTLYDLSYNKPSVNWYISIFTRPRNKGKTDVNGVGFDRFDSIPYVSNFDLWHTGLIWDDFNLSNMKWKNDLNVPLTWKQLTMIQINSSAPYGNIEYNGDQQIMAIAITTNYADFNGYIKNVKLTFNDGRYIQMI